MILYPGTEKEECFCCDDFCGLENGMTCLPPLTLVSAFTASFASVEYARKWQGLSDAYLDVRTSLPANPSARVRGCRDQPGYFHIQHVEIWMLLHPFPLKRPATTVGLMGH